MKNRIFSVILLLVLMFTLPGNTQATSPAFTNLPTLVYVSLGSPNDIGFFASTQLPMYAMLDGGLLTGANRAGRQSLQEAGLSIQVLDPDMLSGSYYQAETRSSRPAPDFSAYGLVLLKTANGVLLRMDPPQVDALTQAGAELRLITLTPKPLPTIQKEEIFPNVVEPDPLIQGMINQITETQVYTYDRQLAGELPVWVDEAWYTITSRYTYSGTPIHKTTSFVGQHMADLGLDVEYHNWGDATYPNVIGQITGLTNPEDIYIIGAHIDDVPGTPGADDNASGSVDTLLAADILSQYQWGCTLRFAFWTGEEQGLLGSAAYAHRAFDAGENILGYLNLDMLAWNTVGSPAGIDLLYNPSMPPTLELANVFSDTVDAYNLNLIPDLVTSLGGGSDHSSFWDYNYTSILSIEDQGDFNPCYHGSQDTPAHTNLAYFTEFVKASIATYAHMSGCLIPNGVGYLDGLVTDAETGSPLYDATVIADDNQGHTYSYTTDVSGYYTMTLLVDTYTVTASLNGYIPQLINTTITSDEVTTLGFELQEIPCEPVTTADLTWLPTDPVNGELVTFTGSSDGSDPITYTWDFGDSSGGTGITATHTYADSGDYTVEISATNACGSDLVSKNITILQKILEFFLPLLNR